MKSNMARRQKETEVSHAVTDFLRHLRERNASLHTIKAYSGDLANFAAYAGSRGWKDLDHIAIRGFLSQLYEKGLGKTSVARSLAAVRSLYKWLAREGVVEQNPAKLVSRPKLAKKLPRVPTIEEMNGVLDGPMPEVAAFPERDRLMLELLYGCGVRNSELTGINIDDIHASAEIILIRRKPWPFICHNARRYYKRLRRTRTHFWSIAEVDASPRVVSAASSKRSPSRKVFRRTCIRTRYVTPSARICSRKAPICGRFRNYSDMSVWQRRSDTRSFP
jgi:site-specific recombinase XerD